MLQIPASFLVGKPRKQYDQDAEDIKGMCTSKVGSGPKEIDKVRSNVTLKAMRDSGVEKKGGMDPKGGHWEKTGRRSG